MGRHLRNKMPRGVSVDTQTDILRSAPAMNWDDYRFFLTVARVGNFRRAAAELETTQATVSRRIENLERALNQKLFDRPRGRGGVVLTFDGRRVLQDVTTAEISLDRAGRLARAENGIAGDCKILGTDEIANHWMPPFLAMFAAKYPNVQLKYFLTTDQAQSQRPPYDLQLQYLGASEADSVSLQLATLHFTFFASQEYVVARGLPKDLAALNRHRVLKFSSFLSDERSWSEYWVDIANQNGIFCSNSSAFLFEMVKAGAGVAMLPTYIAPANPRLVPILSDYHLKMGIFLNFHPTWPRKRPFARQSISSKTWRSIAGLCHGFAMRSKRRARSGRLFDGFTGKLDFAGRSPDRTPAAWMISPCSRPDYDRGKFPFAKETMDRLATSVAKHGMAVLARIDHAAAAAKAGLSLRPTEVLIFGNPAAGTPLMQAAQTMGIDLPLKALVWQDLPMARPSSGTMTPAGS